MSWIELYEPPAGDPSPLAAFPARAEVVRTIAARSFADLVIIGGGIHGATLARCAAYQGISTVLFEGADYAGATSSRSSKMAHGGLRYLEQFDFRQVFEGIRAREDLFVSASHLVRPHEFFIPVTAGDRWFRLKLGVGLFLYDLLVRDRNRRHRWVGPEGLPAGAPGVGGFIYWDGIMDDVRVVLENLIAARQEGALCLNHAPVDRTTLLENGRVRVEWHDGLSGTSAHLEAGVVVNCAGPWAGTAGRAKPGQLARRLRFSQGSHLLFRTPWRGPARFLPLPERGRYYFVWPHPAGTLVGTTERELEEPPLDPEPTPDEVEELLGRLRQDLPDSGLDRSTLHYAFAGVRSLPVRGVGRKTSRLSRRHRWVFQNGVLTLLGGKYTTAAWTALEGLRTVYRLARLGRRPVSLARRPLPGAGDPSEFRQRAARFGASPAAVERCINRLGNLGRMFPEDPVWFEVLPGGILRGEVEFALAVEQAESIEDLMRRHLGLEYLDGHGLESLAAIAAIVRLRRPELDVDAQVAGYRSRLDQLHHRLGIPSAAQPGS